MRLLDTEAVPPEISIYSANGESGEYAEGASPVDKWSKNYVSSELFKLTGFDENSPLGGMNIELIEKTDGNHVLSIKYDINGVPVHDSLPIKNETYGDIQAIVKNIENVGMHDRSGSPFVCMLGNSKKSIVIDGYNAPLFPLAKDVKYSKESAS